MSGLSLEEQWKNFKFAHNKEYTDEEEPRRLEIFKENLQKIEEHNKKFEAGEVTYQMGVNKFADLTSEEMSQFRGFKPREK
ncbi:digestive cysteine proteinase 1-like [Diabrotica virgifera virgifera]|uniref:Digestive cysteine proteinase 1-like n=1 Tax=Diabrotica virgifera virgifera TaxID=50390 RepID=A0A6P7GYY0_DIAVI|nr:digestive cysteine proteinase 1-like [Diabrotica virgifera virgifera]